MSQDTFNSHGEHPLFWTGVTGKERYQAIKDIETCVGEYGFITEFKQFSDLDINICIEVETVKLKALFKALELVIHLDQDESTVNTAKDSQIVYLHLSFLQGRGNLTTEVPAVPG